jgi:hypothetical protein
VPRHAVLPASYADEESKVYPAYAWLRKNNPLGLAKLDNYCGGRRRVAGVPRAVISGRRQEATTVRSGWKEIS